MFPMVPVRLCLPALAAVCMAAQTVRVYSEFQRLDPKGEILAVDRSPKPREILSPAVVRNAHASFSVAVSVPKDKPFNLFLGQNPEQTFKPAVYKVGWEQRGAAWWPDRLTPLGLSSEDMVADAGPLQPGQTAVVYLLDLWVPAKAPVGRVRLEVQLNVGEEWIICPMEVRVTDTVSPGLTEPGAPLAPVTASAECTARETMRLYLCGGGKKEPEGPLTIRGLIRRNARQDAALARVLEARCTRDVLSAALLGMVAPQLEAAAWCQAPAFPAGQGAEWYLRVRDYLYRAADRGCKVDPAITPTITVTPVPKQP